MKVIGKILKLLLCIVLVLVLLLGLALGVFTAAEYRPAETEALIPAHETDAVLEQAVRCPSSAGTAVTERWETMPISSWMEVPLSILRIVNGWKPILQTSGTG